MTINCFADNCDGGGPSECDGQYHGDNEMVVALSTGWHNHGSRCSKYIRCLIAGVPPPLEKSCSFGVCVLCSLLCCVNDGMINNQIHF
ncbi:putative ripening-related protein 7 [Acorus gramineus]|uniref:Ripening-related protein 7 n=1 Tax=Acorus gramineus TaxID=55184 RepID=A0AAV9A9G5_ACOGR|nr:putative ripening-related protein 7 [Acorus gramineus]